MENYLQKHVQIATKHTALHAYKTLCYRMAYAHVFLTDSKSSKYACCANKYTVWVVAGVQSTNVRVVERTTKGIPMGTVCVNSQMCLSQFLVLAYAPRVRTIS